MMKYLDLNFAIASSYGMCGRYLFTNLVHCVFEKQILNCTCPCPYVKINADVFLYYIYSLYSGYTVTSFVCCLHMVHLVRHSVWCNSNFIFLCSVVAGYNMDGKNQCVMWLVWWWQISVGGPECHIKYSFSTLGFWCVCPCLLSQIVVGTFDCSCRTLIG